MNIVNLPNDEDLLKRFEDIKYKNLFWKDGDKEIDCIEFKIINEDDVHMIERLCMQEGYNLRLLNNFTMISCTKFVKNSENFVGNFIFAGTKKMLKQILELKLFI